jgi:hypothetical protein
VVSAFQRFSQIVSKLTFFAQQRDLVLFPTISPHLR